MEILQIVAIGIIATILAVILKHQNPQIAIHISIVTGLIIFLLIVTKLNYVVQFLSTLAEKVEIDLIYFTTILKVIGIAYIAEFGAQVSRDAGEEAIASKIELAGKVLIMVISIPVMSALLDLITKIMP